MDKCDQILELVWVDYFKRDQAYPEEPRYYYAEPKPKERHYLRNGSAFARKCQGWGFGGEDGVDDSALRKRAYKETSLRIRALRAALEKKWGARLHDQ